MIDLLGLQHEVTQTGGTGQDKVGQVGNSSTSSGGGSARLRGRGAGRAVGRAATGGAGVRRAGGRGGHGRGASGSTVAGLGAGGRGGGVVVTILAAVVVTILAAVVLAVALDNLDALPVARAVGVLVLSGAGRVVGDLDRLVDGGEGSLGEVGQTASPVNGALVAALGATNPGADADLAGGLGVAVGTGGGFGALQGADDLAVDNPLELVLGPVKSVGQGGVHAVGRQVVELATAIDGVITLGEVVALDTHLVVSDVLLYKRTLVNCSWQRMQKGI